MKCKNCGSENMAVLYGHYSTSPYSFRVKCQDCKCEYDILTNQIDMAEAIMSKKEDYNFIPIKKTTKLLIIEDGSIDLGNCEQDLLDMGIKVLVYRQGSQPPKLYDLGEQYFKTM